jgi:hypothetical protein
MTPRRVRLLLPKRPGDPRASAAAFVVQLLLIAIIVPALIVPITFELLRDDAGNAVRPERISFIMAAPRGGAVETEAPRAGGDGRPPGDRPADANAPAAPVAPLVAPTEVPTAVFPQRGPVRADPAGTGPIIGGGGPTRGIQPSFTDRRLWLPESEIIQAPAEQFTRADSLRMMLAERTAEYLDSLARLPSDARPGDWTFERNGKKYGIDQGYIRLGDFSLPTALLAALPLNAQANPIARERVLRLDAMRAEIQMQSARMARDDEFRAAVRALRERKERERKEAEEQRRAEAERPARP